MGHPFRPNRVYSVLISILFACILAFPVKADESKTKIYLPFVSVYRPGGAVVILDNYSTRIVGNFLYVIGEVANDTADNIILSQVKAKLYNSENQRVGFDSADDLIDVIPANRKTCFTMIFPNPGEEFTIQFEEVEYYPNSVPMPQLIVYETNNHIQPDSYKLVGMVKNNSASMMYTYINVVGSMYDDSGKIVECNATGIHQDILMPDSSSAFIMETQYIDNYDYTRIASTTFQVSGSQMVIDSPRQNDAVLLDNYTVEPGSDGSLRVFGEVENQGVNNLWGFYVPANLFDAQNHFLDTATNFEPGFSVAIHDKVCFSLKFDHPGLWTTLRFEDIGYSPTTNIPKLTVTESNGAIQDGKYNLTGTIRNDDTVPLNFVTAFGTLYDANSKVIGCGWVFAWSDVTPLNPKESVRFKIEFPIDDRIKSYRIHSDGSWQ